MQGDAARAWRRSHLDDAIAYKQIYTGEKTRHFAALRDQSGIDFDDIGFFELKLSDIYEKGDILDRRVQVLDKNDNVIGHVRVSVQAQSALRSIMADP